MNNFTFDQSLRELLRTGIARLRDQGVSSHTLAAELLLLHVIGRERTWLYSHPEEIVSPEQIQEYGNLIARRIAGEPTQHLTGKQEFWGLTFEITPDVLIPRPETEHLIEVALDRLAVRDLRAGRRARLTGEGISILDVGTGSGCIAITLAKEFASATVFATDVSPAALAIAKLNSTRLLPAHRLQFVESDLLTYFETAPQSFSKFDLIISNPPYIGLREKATLTREVRDYEPATALFGGEEGYELYGPLVAQSARFLKPEGLLVLELGHDSLSAVQPLLETPQWTNILVTNDLAGIPRVLSAERLP